jgi:hypothetical protein
LFDTTPTRQGLAVQLHASLLGHADLKLRHPDRAPAVYIHPSLAITFQTELLLPWSGGK